MKTVLAFGTFDILHPGHISYLRQAKGLGKRLVVIVATDSNVEKAKGSKPVYTQQERLALVRAVEFVDKALLGEEDDLIRSVEKVNPGIVALGYDQRPADEELGKVFAQRGIRSKIVRLEAYQPEVFKSSKLKEKIVKGAER